MKLLFIASSYFHKLEAFKDPALMPKVHDIHARVEVMGRKGKLGCSCHLPSMHPFSRYIIKDQLIEGGAGLDRELVSGGIRKKGGSDAVLG